MLSRSWYKKAPVSVQSGLITMRALARKFVREGRTFDRLLSEIKKSQHGSAGELALLHEKMLGGLLSHAVSHVPFYRDLQLDEALMGGSAVEALQAFPIIDKDVVREQGAKFLADNARRPLVKGSTSGTTGMPLFLFQDLNAINRENAFIWRQLQWAGLKRGDRRAVLRGDLVVPVDVNTPPFWRRNHAENMLMLSSYHLSDKNVPGYFEALERFDPVVIQAFPSSAGFLAKWLETNNRCYAGAALKGIVTSSETLGEDQQALIEARFGCRVFDWYGQFERVSAIGTCEHGRHHIVSDYSFVELMPEGDGLFEIVGTGFNNFAMPLIRYRTGDYVRVDDGDARCDCGRAFPLVKTIVGRADDDVVLPDGRHIALQGHVFRSGVDGILEAQIRQDRSDQIDILVVPAAGYSEEMERKLLSNARARVGNGIQLQVKVVDAIPRSKNGKFRGIVRSI